MNGGLASGWVGDHGCCRRQVCPPTALALALSLIASCKVARHGKPATRQSPTCRDECWSTRGTGATCSRACSIPLLGDGRVIFSNGATAGECSTDAQLLQCSIKVCHPISGCLPCSGFPRGRGWEWQSGVAGVRSRAIACISYSRSASQVMCAFAEAQSRRRRVDRPTGRPGSLLDTHAGSHDAGAQEVANHGEAAVNVPTAPQPVPASGEELVCLWRAVVKDRAGMESHKPRRSSVPSRSPATAPSPQLTVSLHAYLVTRFIARCIRCLSRVADAPVFTMVEHAGAWLGQPYVVGRYRTQSVLASRRDERPSCSLNCNARVYDA